MDYLLHIFIVSLIYAIFAISLNLELGFAGLYNFGHVAFFGIGAYTSALLSLAGYPVSLAMVCGMVLSGAVGALLAIPALRLSGDYFGIATLSFGEIIRLFFLNERWLTKGPMGLPGISRPAWIGEGVAGLPRFLIFCTLLTLLVFLVARRLTRSPFGRALKVIREDEYVAQALGKNTLSFKIRAVAAGSILAGLAGSLWAHYISYISPADFTLNRDDPGPALCGAGWARDALGSDSGRICRRFLSGNSPVSSDPRRFCSICGPDSGDGIWRSLILLMLKRPEGLLPEYKA